MSHTVMFAVLVLLLFSVVSFEIHDFKNMEVYGVVPDVIDSVPPRSIKIKYEGDVEVNQGAELTPTQVQNQPILFEYDADPNDLYTVAFVDPDPPPPFREILHWLVLNVPGSDVSKGVTHTQYLGSGPPQGSGKQRGAINYDGPEGGFNGREARLAFNTRDFASKNNLGQPIAGNFYRAQYDDYVPILHAKLANAKV